MNTPYYLLRGGYLSYSLLDYAGSYGYYWSSTPNSSSTVLLLYFYSGYIDANNTLNGIRYYGRSVRCVAAG